LLEHGLALLEVEEGLALLWVAQRRNDHLVEQTAGAFDDLQMPVVKGVEGSREEPDLHELVPFRRATVTSVPPYRRSLVITQPSGSTTGAADSITTILARRAPSKASES